MRGQNASTEVAIVGAGLAGALCASVLGNQGFSVTLIDYRADVPADFRVEKIAGDQLAALSRINVIRAVAERAVEFD